MTDNQSVNKLPPRCSQSQQLWLPSKSLLVSKNNQLMTTVARIDFWPSLGLSRVY